MRDGVLASSMALLFVLVLASPAVAESAVTLDEIITLSDTDLGLSGADIDPEGKRVLAYGADGHIELIFARTPGVQLELVWDGDEDLNDASWHPGGGTALIVGDEGLVLRYAKDDHSITYAGERLNFGQTELREVAWNTAGSWAYIGGENGWLWRVRANGDGGLDVHEVEGRGGGHVTGIDCHDDMMLCVVSSSSDGIGLIDRDHRITWLGGVGYPWVDVICPSNYEAECVAISAENQVAEIVLHSDGAGSSAVYISDISGAEGQFRGLSHQDDDRSLIIVIPFALLEHDISANATYPWLSNDDAKEFDSTMAGDRIVGSWSTGEDSGWIVTSRGYVIEYHPPSKAGTIGGLLGVWIGFAIPLAIGFAVLSLLFTASPKAQDWLTMKIGTDEEKRSVKRKASRQKKRR